MENRTDISEMTNKKLKSTSCVRGGFSLLETLVALAILNAAVLGPITLAYNSIRSASLSHDKAVASFLAEEAMEMVRVKRDSNVYQGKNWLDSLSVCTAASPCKVDATQTLVDAVQACVSGCMVKYNYDALNNTGFYGHLTGNDTIFTRTMSVNETAVDKEAVVTVTVSWKERFLPITSQMEIQDYIFNWH